MGISKEVVHNRVADIVGVPLAQTLEHISIPPLRQNKRLPKHPPLKRVRITKERGDLTRSGYIYKAMTNLGVDATQLKYDVMLRSLKGVDKPQKVANKQTTPEGEISCTVPELVHVATKPEISGSNDSLPHYPVIGSKVYIKWDEQQIGVDTYAKGRSPGLILRPPSAPSKPKLPVLSQVTPVAKPIPPKPPIPAVKIPVTPPVARPKPPVKITPKRPAEIAKRITRKVSARAEELMKKRVFPRAVKEAIEKGLERKEAPRDIERIIEKVAKINEPDYILRRTIARRISRGDRVQYKVDTDKGTIIYETADDNTANAILGMPTPTGEVIPLQIKVIR